MNGARGAAEQVPGRPYRLGVQETGHFTLVLGERTNFLDEIEAGGDAKAREYAEKLDKYTGEIVVSRAEIEAAAAQVPQQLKEDIAFSHDQVRRFAEAQKAATTVLVFLVGLSRARAGE